MKCSHCGKTLSPARSRNPQHSGAGQIGESRPAYGNMANKTITIKCRSCGAINVIADDLFSLAPVEQEAPQSPAVLTREVMRRNIIVALKAFYPRYRGYNGGYLAPVRDPDPDLFMSVLTELEQEGVIEYNDTQIALRLSQKYFDTRQERA